MNSLPDEPGVRLVDVAVSVPGTGERLYQYRIPSDPGPVAPGMRVLVPFGARSVPGYVVAVDPPPRHPDLKWVEALEAEGPGLGEEQMALALWLARRYQSDLAPAIACFLPPAGRLHPVGGNRKGKARPEPGQPAQASEAEGPGVAGDGWPEGWPEAGAAGALDEGTTADSGMMETGDRALAGGRVPAPAGVPALTREQEAALAPIRAALEQGRHQCFLLHGVTGSGKTEVYLRAIAAVLSTGRQAIVLVPEIALTPQTLRRFERRFPGQVAIWHSRLRLSERRRVWGRIASGRAPVVVGTRSAVFAPVPRLGLIVVDEEHETSYKQEEMPRYHAREVAMERCRRSGAVTVLGSATPSLESHWMALQGQSRRLLLTRRVQERPMPEIRVVDMRQELAAGQMSLLSRTLREALVGVRERGEQAILFLNRRGYAAFVLCRECGEALTCPHCQVTLTYHRAQGRLRCHYCDHQQGLPPACPRCGSRYLRPFGIGTERVEQAVAAEFDGLRVARLDADTAAAKDAYDRILSDFAAGRTDVLVGTQMIAKGLHFPRVTLVGVVSADVALHLPDFRAAERTYQLLTQVAGRAGRGDRPGLVVVQTYRPEHYSIQSVARGDEAGFLQQEMAYRRRAGYPPFTVMVRWVVSDGEADGARAAALELGRLALELARPFRSLGYLRQMGPSPAPLARVRGRYRWHMALSGERHLVEELVPRLAAAAAESRTLKRATVTVDVDPVSVL